jgi:hypothetical protein
MSILDPGVRPGQAGGDKLKLTANIVFSGESEGLDVDAAAAELRQAGYEVLRLPDEYRGRLSHPLDDFIEAHIECADDPEVMIAIMNDVNAIVDKYAGLCLECGRVERDHVLSLTCSQNPTPVG